MTKLSCLAGYCTKYMFCKGDCWCLVDGRRPIYKKLFYAGITMEDSRLIKKMIAKRRLMKNEDDVDSTTEK
jgi:hypothetical protein